MMRSLPSSGGAGGRAAESTIAPAATAGGRLMMSVVDKLPAPKHTSANNQTLRCLIEFLPFTLRVSTFVDKLPIRQCTEARRRFGRQSSMKIHIREGDIHLTNLRTRLPFKYGIVTMTSTP